MATMNIDRLLKKYKLNQRELAEGTGINENTISRYCNGTFKKIDKSHISLICKYFKCTPNDIFEIDTTVDVKPAKIVYYDDKTDNFTYNEIAPTKLKFYKPFTWGTSIIVKSPIENSIKQASKIDTPNDTINQSEILEYPDDYNSEEFEDPTAIMNTKELAEYRNSVDKYQIRFNTELEVDELVDTFINKIIESYISNIIMDDSFKKTFENYKQYDYFTTNLKVKRFYRILHPFLSIHSKDYNLLLLLDNIKNIYDNGGLEKNTDKELDELKSNIDYYIENGIPIIPINKKTRT